MLCVDSTQCCDLGSAEDRFRSDELSRVTRERLVSTRMSGVSRESCSLTLEVGLSPVPDRSLVTGLCDRFSPIMKTLRDVGKDRGCGGVDKCGFVII